MGLSPTRERRHALQQKRRDRPRPAVQPQGGRPIWEAFGDRRYRGHEQGARRGSGCQARRDQPSSSGDHGHEGHVERKCDEAALAAAWKSADVEGSWAKSAWGKKIARQNARANLTDFERFKVALARTKRSALIKKALAA